MGTIKTMSLAIWTYNWLRWVNLFGVTDKARLQYFLSYESKNEAHAIRLSSALEGLDVHIYRTGIVRRKWHVWAASTDIIEVTHDSFSNLLKTLTIQACTHNCRLVGYSARFKGGT